MSQELTLSTVNPSLDLIRPKLDGRDIAEKISVADLYR